MHVVSHSKLYAWMQITCNHILLSTCSLNIFIPYGVTDICNMHELGWAHVYLTERLCICMPILGVNRVAIYPSAIIAHAIANMSYDSYLHLVQLHLSLTVCSYESSQ